MLRSCARVGVGVVLVAVVLAVQAGCEQRVVRQRSFYPGQFSHVTNARPATAAPREVKKTDFLQDAFRGLGDLFDGGDDDDDGRRIMTVEELRKARAKREAERAAEPAKE